MNVDQEPLGFRWKGFSPFLSLLMPTFSLPAAPVSLTTYLQRHWNAPLPLLRAHSFGIQLNARKLSTPGRSTSELLRTL